MDAQSQVEDALRKVNPSVRLVRDRHLRRAARELFDLAARRPTNPDTPLRIDRQFAAGLEVFPPWVTEGEEQELLLFSTPRDRHLSDASPGDIVGGK